MKNHDGFYSFAEAYDVAFDFKDVGTECSFMEGVFESSCGRRAESFLELAAGPASHAQEMARRGLASAALDLSREMREYGLERAHQAGLEVDYRLGDMSSFAWNRSFDLAGIFMDSTCYLTTNESFLSHLRSVADALTEGGLYVLEMSHPRDVFSVGRSTQNSWETERNGWWTSVKWGDPSDAFDPISQITETTVQFRYKYRDHWNETIEKAQVRSFTCNEFKALVQAEGSFDLVHIYGAMNTEIALTNEKSAWRMIPILKKK